MGVAERVSTSTWRESSLSFSFVGHAEALLLVDDQQAQVFEVHVLLEEPVGADEQVDLPSLQLS